jgi:paraquat-inducible protein B
VGIAAAQSAGMSVAGDNYTLTDSATISQDQISTVTTTETTTETTTSTASSTESTITDSYNTLDNTRNQTFTPNTTVTFEGSQMTLADLVTYLSSINSSYSLTVGDEIVATSNDEVDEPAEDVTCVPTFEGYQCTGG